MSDYLQRAQIKRHLRLNNLSEIFDRYYRHIFRTEVSPLNQWFMNTLPTTEEAQNILSKYIQENNEFLLIRFGLYEYLLCYQFLEKKNGLRKSYSQFIRQHIANDAGIIFNSDKHLDAYAEEVISGLKQVDVIAYWRNYPNPYVFELFYDSGVSHINVEDLYPFPFWHKSFLPTWQKCLRNKKVLVVTSFAETVARQYAKRICLWKDADIILPSFDLLTYQAVCTNGGFNDTRFSCWDEAVTYMESEILNMCFDIVLVSCGGYGLPLSMRLKKRKKKVIQWGGCYQLWFGILGGRWSDDIEILKFKNRFWTYPSKMETPPLANEVNESCYWNPKTKL